MYGSYLFSFNFRIAGRMDERSEYFVKRVNQIVLNSYSQEFIVCVELFRRWNNLPGNVSKPPCVLNGEFTICS